MSDNYTPKTEWELQYEKEYKRILQAIRRQKKLGYSVPAEVKPTQPSKVKKITKTDVEHLMQITPKKIREQSVQEANGLGAVAQHKVANITHKHRKSKQKVYKVYSELPKQRKPKQNKQKEPTKPQTKTPENKQADVNDTTPENKQADVNDTTQTGFTAPPKENNLNVQIIDDITAILNQWQPQISWTPSFHQRKLQNYYTLTQVWSEILENEGEYETAYRIESNAQEIKDLILRVIYDSDSQLEDEINLARLLTLLFGRAITAHEADYYTETAQSMAQDTLMGENSIV